MKTTENWSVGAVLLLGTYVALVPSISLIPSVGPYNEKRALQIGLLLVAGGILLASRSARQQWLSVFRALPRSARWGLVGVLGLGCLSSTLAPAPFYAFLEVGHFTLLFAAAGLVASAVRDAPERAKWLLLGAVSVSVLLYTAYFTIRYGGSLILPALEIGRETIGGFTNIRHFNQYQTWTLPLLAVPVLTLPKRWWIARGSVFGLLALWWTLVLASNVRGTVVAVGIAAAGVWLLFRNRARRWLGVQTAALLVGGGLYYVLFHLGGGAAPQIVERLGNVGQSRRLQHWWTCMEMARAHPWLGVGPMHYAWPPNDFAVAAHPHSAFFQWLAEWGLPSTVVMGGLTVWGGWSWMQHERETTAEPEDFQTEVGIALVAAVLAGASHAMVSGLIVMPVSQILLAVVGGWAWGRYSFVGKDANLRSSRWSHVILCVVIVGSMFTVGASLQDLTTVEERREAFLDAVDRNVLSPRYWTQGYLNVRDPGVIRRAVPD